MPGVVVGVGSEIPRADEPDRARQKFGLAHPFVLYVGRIDANKGCAELFDLFIDWLRVRYLTLRERDVDLVLIGTRVIDIPDHPRIRHLGFVTDADKFDVLAAASLLVMPSYYESLSMVALEAWALGRPVLANARCDVLLGQCLRSNAGLYYENAEEFGDALDTILDVAGTGGGDGRAGAALLRRALRLARHRTQVPGHVRAPRRRIPRPRDGAAARLPRAAQTGQAACRRGRRLAPRAVPCAPRPRCRRPAGEARLHHASLRRRDRERARARVPHPRRAGQPAPRRRRPDHLRPRVADVEERVPGRTRSRAGRPGAPLSRGRAARSPRVLTALAAARRVAAVA